MRVLTAVALALFIATAARAQSESDEPSPPPSDEPAPPSSEEPAPPAGEEPSKPAAAAPQAQPTSPETLDHRYQVGLGFRLGTGYRVIMPYNEEFCGKADKSVCGGRQPFWIEISPSFGVTESLEVLADIRLFLEEDFTTSKGFFVSPGIKYYTDPESIFKFFATGQLVFESQDQMAGSGLSSFDFGLRSALGLQFDFMRYVGLYAQGGIIIGFKRWLTFVVDGGGGIQIRY